MNNSIKRLLLTVMSCLTITLVSAQGTTEEAARIKATNTASELKASLNLTTEQHASVIELMTLIERKKEGAKDASAITTYMNQEMGTILSPSQLEVWLRSDAAKNPKVEADKAATEKSEKGDNHHQE